MHSSHEQSKLDEKSADLATGKLRIDLLSRAARLRDHGEYAQAQSCYKQILSITPGDVDALLGLGLLAQKLKKEDLATAIFSKIIDLDETYYQAFFQRGRLFSQNKKYDLAIRDFDATLAIQPNFFEAVNSRGIVHTKRADFNAALSDFCTAVLLRPQSADAYYNRALAYMNLGKVDLAVDDYTAAIAYNPSHFQAFNNRGMAFRELRLFDEAIDDFGSSIALQPDFADGYWNKALTHLMVGDYETAWQLYEHRWDSPNFPSRKRDLGKPLWLGAQSLNGKTILLHSEQGLGDSLQFCRYIKNFEELPCTVLLEIERPLMRIMECLLPAAQIFEKGSDLPAFDFHCPLLSLPLAFNTTVETIPFSSSYLAANQDRIRWWQGYLGETKKPRIGLVWQGNPDHPKDQKRSIKLASIVNDLTTDFDWYSLQLQISDEEKCLVDQSTQLTHIGPLIGDFFETAALCNVLDATVCVDTSIAHLCGAIGLPVHLLLNHTADSRWHYSGEHTPWYSSVTLHRKAEDAPWNSLLRKITDQLKKT